MKYLALIIIFLTSVVTHGATLNGVLYDSSTKDIKPSSNVLVGTFSSVSTVTLLGGTATLTNALTVPNGGSGVATLALNGVLYGNGAGAILALPVNSTATTKFLSQVSSGAPVWAVPAFGSGTAGVNLRWASGGATAEDGYFIDGSGFTVPRTNNSATFGSTTNRLAGVNSVNVNFSGQLTSTIASGTPPFVISSTTEIANLNAQKWGGKTLDYLNVGFILGDTAYWNASGNPTRLLPNQNTNIAFYVQYGTGNAYPDISVAPFWMQVSAGSNISISRSSLTNFTINASTAAGVAVGTGTTGTYTKWSDGLGGLTDGALAASSGTNATLTGNLLANRAVFTNSVGVGTSTPVTEFSVSSTNTTDPRGILSGQYTTDAVGARIHMRKARGTEAVPLTVVTTDILGRVRFSGYDSANYIQTASIDVGALGTIAATRVPSYLAFSVGTDVAPTVLTERMRILPSGNVGIGVASPAAKLDVLSTTEQLRLSYDSTHYASFTVDSAGKLTVNDTTGSFLFNGVLGGSEIQAGVSSYFSWPGRSYIGSPSSGVITLLDGAATSFGRLQLGGTTASFPAIKRSSTTVAFRLADDSSDAPISASGLTLSTTLTVPSTITTVGTTGNQTINKMAGRVNVAAGGTTITVTDSLVTTASIIMCTIATNDATATLKNCVPGTGSFVINLTAAATAETAVSFLVVN